MRSLNQRAALRAKILKEYKQIDKTVVVNESSLVLASAALATQNQIVFPVLANEAANLINYENRLQIADAFYVTSIGIYLLKIPTGQQAAQQPLYTNNDPLVFTGASEADNLNNVYSGQLQIQINQTTYVKGFDTRRFYRVGQNIKGVAVSTVASVGLVPLSQWDSDDYGHYPIYPELIFDGKQNNQVQITCPNSLNMAGTGSANHVVMIAHGMLVQGGSLPNR